MKYYPNKLSWEQQTHRHTHTHTHGWTTQKHKASEHLTVVKA